MKKQKIYKLFKWYNTHTLSKLHCNLLWKQNSLIELSIILQYFLLSATKVLTKQVEYQSNGFQNAQNNQV